MKVLMVHQGVELYGSDRSFISSVKAFYGAGYNIDVVLPGMGELNSIIGPMANEVYIRPRGYIRKADIKKKPVATIFHLVLEIFNMVNLSRKYDVVYVNTVVCISSIFSLIFLAKRKGFIHVREIPTGISMMIFRLILRISGASLIYNSVSTKNSFDLDGQVVLNGVAMLKKVELLREKNSDGILKLLVIGRINSWKGQDFLLKTLASVDRKFELRIVGGVFSDQNHFLDELKNIAFHNKIDVDFYDFCEDTACHYEWSDYVIVPSKLPEPFGRVAVEAFSMAKPVVASAHGGLLEIINDGENGYLFEPNNVNILRSVINALPITHSVEYQSLKENAFLSYLNNFSEEAYMQKLLKAINR
tara:strand:+ start:487 stop:1566 length:1080 start_codon:yes stop_codon:yes gene_type:complete